MKKSLDEYVVSTQHLLLSVVFVDQYSLLKLIEESFYILFLIHVQISFDLSCSKYFYISNWHSDLVMCVG